MKIYKGFDKNLVCTPPSGAPFQYEIGKTYKTDKAAICESGFHGCINPVDILNYYPPCKSRYCECELEGDIQIHEDDSKVCGKEITIIKELSQAEFLEVCFEYMQTLGNGFHTQTSGHRAHAQTLGNDAHAQSSGKCAHAQTSGRRAHAQTLGDCAHAQTSGYDAHAQTLGDWAHAQTSGTCAHAQSSGYGAKAQSSGYGAKAQTSGYDAHAQTLGDWAHAQTSGKCAHAQTSGHRAHAECSGKNSIAISIGYKGTAQVSKNSQCLVLAEYNNISNLVGIHIGLTKDANIDINVHEIELDTKYIAQNGKLESV